MNYNTVISDINTIYNTLGVNWQQGKHIVLNNVSKFRIEKDNRNLVPILDALHAHSDYKQNQYYMIISPVYDEFGGFAEYTLKDNWFIIQKTYDKRVPPHELGHCNGLDEFVVNIGLLPKERRNESSEYLSYKFQFINTNVMGYSKKGYTLFDNPLLDFYSWQMLLIRQKINERINSGQ